MSPLARAWPIGRYALAFLLLLAMAMAILGGLLFRDLDHLHLKIKQGDEKLAQQELQEALALLRKSAESYAQALATWDEARQQLENPTYYAYWRKSRALDAGILPKNLDAVDLYNLNRQNLSPARSDEQFMPATIGAEDMQPTVVRERGHDHLYVFAPIFGDKHGTVLLGYAGIKMDVLLGIRDLRTFRYLDLGSLRFEGRDGEKIHLDRIAERARFQTLANPETRALELLTHGFFFEIAGVVAVLSLIGYFALISIIANPLKKLSEHIEAMRRGKDGLLTGSYRGALAVMELENVRHSLNDYQQQLSDMHISLAHKNEELWALAHHDPLTGLFNRRAFDDDWQASCRIHGNAPLEIAFLLFDCDHFKAINDTYGHQVGDQVIQGLAVSLHGALRSGDRLYRLGGDEFATLLHATDIQNARQVAERCIAQVNTYDFGAHGVKEPVRISIGIAHAHSTGEGTLETLHRHADVAMYHAKRPGQPKIAVYAPEMGTGNESLVSNAETNAVYEAITNTHIIEMHYQPVVSIPSEQTAYHEALVRIRHGEKLVMPSHIFPVVELRGVEYEFDLAVFECVRRDLEAARIPAGSGVSINISGPSIVHANILDALMRFVPFLKSYKLVLEITETALITQITHASANLNQLRNAGFRIALDDFGSGYSSLRYLASMPVDLVKFDISMVRSLEDGGRQALFVEDLARMIKDAGYALVAEGIESETMLKRVARLGFSHAQGFHIGRPAPLTANLQTAI